jgi:hypothetical protein|eukprot:512538-Prymnesium_polylepis.1
MQTNACAVRRTARASHYTCSGNQNIAAAFPRLNSAPKRRGFVDFADFAYSTITYFPDESHNFAIRDVRDLPKAASFSNLG